MDIDKLGDIIIHDLWMTSSSGLGGKFWKNKRTEVTVNIIWSLNGRKEQNSLIIPQEEMTSNEVCKKRDMIPGSLDGVLRCTEDILSVEEGHRPAAFLVGPAGQTVRRLDVWDTPTVSNKNTGRIKSRGLSLLKRVVQCFGRRLRKLNVMRNRQASTTGRQATSSTWQASLLCILR
ncbi:uncharacterized protein LOC118427731 isoform X2 [Branchiostoma floridae]|nr:uncharacterized protein LOC118427731 isoform X2 [Branchiostoma floridae]XP_035693542.1 uncharacterized protein LOC118427731 isoform X2 [Branchiostoma floridae]XP_035693543.1 uncharacterized protein LOC118427731 isoform X2 [Branchiostoma floridae]XP_035693544.1 uncharacterized protein LOC118427731 isoform X2 [Branchiostoma floridae]XP_035693545.1 uncharacterized protein LOC118427731 isoform X2 [Branchiostoma floridae]